MDEIFCDSYCTAQILAITFDMKTCLRKCIFLIHREKRINLSQSKLLQCGNRGTDVLTTLGTKVIHPQMTTANICEVANHSHTCLIIERVTNWHCLTSQSVSVELLKCSVKDVLSCWHSAPGYTSRKCSYSASMCKHSGVFLSYTEASDS